MGKVKKRGKVVKNLDRGRKKKVSILSSEKIEYVDWKDVNLLRRFVSDRAKIRARRVNGNDTQQQKLIADAIKVAREMALIPYASRVTSQRGGRGGRDDRGGRGDRPSGPRRDEEQFTNDDEMSVDDAPMDGDIAVEANNEGDE